MCISCVGLGLVSSLVGAFFRCKILYLDTDLQMSFRQSEMSLTALTSLRRVFFPWICLNVLIVFDKALLELLCLLWLPEFSDRKRSHHCNAKRSVWSLMKQGTLMTGESAQSCT